MPLKLRPLREEPVHLRYVLLGTPCMMASKATGGAASTHAGCMQLQQAAHRVCIRLRPLLCRGLVLCTDKEHQSKLSIPPVGIRLSCCTCCFQPSNTAGQHMLQTASDRQPTCKAAEVLPRHHSILRIVWLRRRQQRLRSKAAQ